MAPPDMAARIKRKETAMRHRAAAWTRVTFSRPRDLHIHVFVSLCAYIELALLVNDQRARLAHTPNRLLRHVACPQLQKALV
jgi:hypothetical protein